MDRAFSDTLADWTGYYTLMGGVGATLLGLLFVAMSLRTDVFRRQEVEDVRDTAAFIFSTFLVAIAIAGLALAPHEAREPLAIAIALFGLSGLCALAWVGRVWRRLNQGNLLGGLTGAGAGSTRAGLIFLLLAAAAYLILIATALLLWRQHAAALGLLAVVEAVMLGIGTIFAWIFLSHAGSGADSG